MGVQRVKLAINNADIPLLSTHAQRAVINAGLDSAPRTPRVFMGADDSADYNLAQVIYGENIMPTAHGVRSVGYLDTVAAHSTGDFDTIFPLRDEQENAVLFSPAHGDNFVYDAESETWAGATLESIWGLTLAAGLSPSVAKVTYAYVDGKTFVCYARMKSTTDVDMSIMQWDSTAKALVPTTAILLNLPFGPGEIDGIASSSGYLLVWSGLTIAWAFFNGTAFDFEIYTNGNFTGSGFQIPEDLQAPITAIIALAGGFLAFTARNCVAANYHSQTISAPWVFREVPDAGGIESYEQATVEGSLGKVMAYTSAGIQAITLNSASHAHPAVADFITQRETESYDFGEHQIQPAVLGSDMFTKVTAVGNRYVVISYGYLPGIFSFALVYDVALQRWGKLRIKHRDCFAFSYQDQEGGVTYGTLLDVTYEELGGTRYSDLSVAGVAVTPAQRALAFMTDQGQIKLATWAHRPGTEDQAVAIVGRVQLVRNRNVQLNRIEADGMKDGNIFVQASFNGRSIAGLWTTDVLEEGADYKIVGTLLDCRNFNLVFEGAFDLSTVIVEITPSGEF